jgi:AcrR family transcriptional regulator
MIRATTELRGNDTRQRIIEAVWSVMAENGLSGLTVRLVGQEAGVSHAMIHYYFASKDELVLSVIEHARSYWIHPMEDIVRGMGTPEEKLESVIVWMAEPATRAVMRIHRQLLSESEWNEHLRRAMAAEYARWRTGFIELFRQLEVAGSLVDGTDVDLLGAGFATLSDNLVGKRALDPSIDSEAIMREMLRPFLVSSGAAGRNGERRRAGPERRTRPPARRR